jgi:hypothetical protein
VTDVRCSFCRVAQVVQLRSDRAVLEQLLEKSCRLCHRTGSLQLRTVEVPPPERTSVHGPPDDLSDEELLEERNRTWRAP